MGHQAKRQYAGSQPSITSYFSASTSSANNHYSISSHQSPTNEGCFPAPPSSVQSNLLSVGMRVRKSVSEGYKTSSYAYSPFFGDNEKMPASRPVSASILAPVLAEKIVPVAKTRPRAGVRELTPFCGILKVGGMAQQAWDIYNYAGDNCAHDEGIYSDEEMEGKDVVPVLSSQGSTISNASVATPVREKRRFLEDQDGEGDVSVRFGDRSMGERVLAVPRRKGGIGTMAVRGLENVSGDDGDFQDAEFLDYGLVGEVEMSG